MKAPAALAIAAHPDDIEFMMAGTLLLLRAAGWQIHYLNVANGSCGGVQYNAARTAAIRRREAEAAAHVLGAVHHSSQVDDLEIYYTPRLLRRVAAAVRETQPKVVLTHSLDDYMEDHMNTARLAVTAAFVRGMPNFVTEPRRAVVDGDVTVYHAMPHTLLDPMGRRVIPEAFVDVSPVHATKLQALSQHRSQQNWLDLSQGMTSYLRTMQDMSAAMGRMSRRFQYAEGWRRHNPAGFCAADADPLRDALGAKYRRNPAYARWLAAGTG